MQNHSLMKRLKGPSRPDKDVVAMFSLNSSGDAVLFIHGFSGDAVDTWSKFDEFIPLRSKFRERDIYFYGYDGLRADIYSSAAIFRGFLSRIFSGELLSSNLPLSILRDNEFLYKKLIIVAHSLGAVIARLALLDATREGLDWAAKVRLVLYAPAHVGASVVKLAQEAVSHLPVVGMLINFAKFKSPLIDQLKEGSGVLLELKGETQKLIATGGNPQLIALKVCIAEYENIVVNKTFCGDPAPFPIENETHTTLCKPRSGFMKPLIALEECV